MVVFSFIMSLVFCVTLISFILGMVVSFFKAKKNYKQLQNNLSGMLDNLNTIPTKLNLGDSYDKDKKE